MSGEEDRAGLTLCCLLQVSLRLPEVGQEGSPRYDEGEETLLQVSRDLPPSLLSSSLSGLESWQSTGGQRPSSRLPATNTPYAEPASVSGPENEN